MTVHWEIENRQYMLLRIFRRWRQAKREADKIERWYKAQGIDVQVKIITEGCGNGETQKEVEDISSVSVLRDEDNAEVD
jgi:hypothetical protein